MLPNCNNILFRVKASKKKTEVVTLNVQDPAPVKVADNPLPHTEQYTYLGSTVRHDVRSRQRHQ